MISYFYDMVKVFGIFDILTVTSFPCLSDDCINPSSLASNTTPGTNKKSPCFWILLLGSWLLLFLFGGLTGLIIGWVFGVCWIVPVGRALTLKGFLDKIYFSKGRNSFRTSLAFNLFPGWASTIFVMR